MVVQVKLLKPWMRLPAGKVTEVSDAIAQQLIADGYAELHTPKQGARPTRTKVAKAESVKG